MRRASLKFTQQDFIRSKAVLRVVAAKAKFARCHVKWEPNLTINEQDGREQPASQRVDFGRRARVIRRVSKAAAAASIALLIRPLDAYRRDHAQIWHARKHGSRAQSD